MRMWIAPMLGLLVLPVMLMAQETPRATSAPTGDVKRVEPPLPRDGTPAAGRGLHLAGPENMRMSVGPPASFVPFLWGTPGTKRAKAFTIDPPSEPTRRLGRSDSVRTHT
jgi:hypothetical protein